MSINLKKTFCTSPFVRMTRSPSGHYRTCVYHPPLKNEYKNIKEAFHSDEMNIIREEMIHGKIRPECEWCYFYDESNQFSCRADINERYDLEEFIKNPVTNLQELDFAASNKCNFICVTCDESSSSGWELRNKEFRFSAEKLKNDNAIDLTGIEKLKQITIMGGEPTIEPYYDDKFWDLIESKVTSDTWYQMVTNCSSFPKKRWMDFLKKLKVVCIGISLDGVGEVGEFCRLGWKERVWRKNFIKWLEFFKRGYKKESRHDGPWINIVVNNYNIFNITETLEYISKFEMRHRVMLTTAFEPNYLCPAYLPNKFKDRISSSIFFDDNHKQFITEVLEKGEESDIIYEKFKQYTKYLNTFCKVPKECTVLI